MSNVIADARFLRPDRLMELRDQGATINRNALLAEMDLPEPKYGETLIGELTDDELELYSELYHMAAENEAMSREVMGSTISKMGETIRTSDAHKPLNEAFKEQDILALADEDQVKALTRIQQRTAMLHACFYYTVGERLDSHNYRLGVRSRGRVVRIEKR